jgi:hypothetical protein
VFFFTRILPQRDQNSGFSISHTGFEKKHLLKRKHLKKKHTWLLAVLTIRPRLAFCHRQPRG